MTIKTIQTSSADYVPNESHYHSKKGLRTGAAAVRPYNLNDELDPPAIAMPRVRKGQRHQVHRRPAGLEPPLRRAQGRHHPDLPPAPGGVSGPGGRSQKHGHA
jgi:hypothetical protein